jgi:dipeptidyl aminopeptidase/acylaminoacyl peptidase
METDADVYRVDVTGKRENLTPHKGQVLYLGSSLSADGRTLLVTSNEKAGFNNVALLDVTSRKLRWVTDTKWDASSGNFAPQGGRYTFTINEDGRTDAYLADRDGWQPERAVTVLKKEGKVVDAHYYPDEGHGFAKRENQIDAVRRTIEWFDRYLKGNEK